MARMVELIRNSAVPVNIMRSASRGALALPTAEMLEILVHLSLHPVFGTEATMTLAGWNEADLAAVVGDPSTPRSVLEYYLNPHNIRVGLLPKIIANSSVSIDDLRSLAATASVEIITAMLRSPRVQESADILRTLASNPRSRNIESPAARQILEEAAGLAAAEEQDVLGLAELDAYLKEHAAEIAAEEGKRFELVRGHPDEEDVLAVMWDELQPAADKAAAQPAQKPKAPPEDQERLSVLQKIARMTVGERVQLAMKGSKDERFVLIRDGSKVVSLAVLLSPKLSEQEMEMFAAMKNVQESVLRGIAANRKFMKQYSVVRALANNPRTPMDVGLTLLPHLLVMDLHHLSKNKNVGDTLRKLALKMHRDKSDTRKG